MRFIGIVAPEVGMTATVGFCAPAFFQEHALPRYLFHLYDDEETLDVEGRVFRDFDAAHADAVQTARAIMGSELASKGEITLSHWIEIETEEGEMHVITFGDSVTIHP